MQPFVATKLAKNVQLMVIFDIPEDDARVRRRLRLLLNEWQFTQVQKSVWVSDFDYETVLVQAVKELGLEKCVQIFECARMYPK